MLDVSARAYTRQQRSESRVILNVQWQLWNVNETKHHGHQLSIVRYTAFYRTVSTQNNWLRHNIYMHARTHTHTHARTHARTHAHTHTHTARQYLQKETNQQNFTGPLEHNAECLQNQKWFIDWLIVIDYTFSITIYYAFGNVGWIQFATIAISGASKPSNAALLS